MRKRTFPGFLVISFYFISGMLFPDTASAHGVGYRILDGNSAVTVEFYYASGDPMPYAKVLVFSPEDEKCEYQNGRTDKQGRFAFHPDKPGSWRIEVNDERGHKVDGRLSINEDEKIDPVVVSKKQFGTFSKKMGAVLGISLIFNLCGAFSLFGKVKKRKNNQA